MSQPPQNNYQQPGQPPYQQQPNAAYPPQGYYQGQQPGYQPQQGYAPQPAYPGAYAAPAQRVKVPGNRNLYFIPLIGVILLAAGAFLPWINLTIQNQSISINGMGSVSGNAELAALYNSAGGGGAKDGVIALSLAVISLILVLVGLLTKARGWAIATIVFGVFSIGLMAYEVFDVNRSTNKVATDSAGLGSSSGGIGLYVGLAGAIIILIGAIVTVTFFRKKQA
ncbi:MAG: hypothetical protein J0I20_20540 [Chloroflexi bacterium]|nr:hypothetical protein [Chloroflexota bacterium]OJV89943.1 MAG: hypothetical protein BGO39_34420 [Chloroflexi bacterium 54-19]